MKTLQSKTLVCTPPMTQVNAPFPASAYLVGFLRQKGFEAHQCDPALETLLKLFSREGLTLVFHKLEEWIKSHKKSDPRYAQAIWFLNEKKRYIDTVEPALKFLQGKDPTLALRIASRTFLPEGPMFSALGQFPSGESREESEQALLQWGFGALGVSDLAKHLATLFLDDLSGLVSQSIDPEFSLSRYGEKLAASTPTFEPLLKRLKAQNTLVDDFMIQVFKEKMEAIKPNVVAFSAPFPGNVYAAFKLSAWIKKNHPEVKVILGGGYANTELRELTEPRVFDYVDAILYDDGEIPIQRYLEYVEGIGGEEKLVRTRIRENGQVVWKNDAKAHDVPQKDLPAPVYDGLPLGKYLQILEVLNPMHRIWSDGRWNKLTLAHGCYWKKCSFCDVTLDYIGRYEASPVDKLLDRMQRLAHETGESGFHFVDEAAPPVVLRELSKKIIEQGKSFSWWGNVRFEKTFTPELCELMVKAGCVAFSGGLEVASPRLLEKMNKGVTVEQVARVTKAMSDAGILVHAYLMYGFPSQTEQETLDSLERVRQLFLYGCIQSGFWHRFSVTAHSPVGKDPEKFGIKILERKPKGARFSRNDLPFVDSVKADHDALGVGLKKALFNFMHGVGLEEDVRIWFEGPIRKRLKKTSVSPRFVLSALEE